MKNSLLWVLALLITVSSAVYQRMTGPTYPISGETEIEGKLIEYELLRTHESTEDCEISVQVQDPSLGGYIIYKRHKTDDPWSKRPFFREGNDLSASLPKQPPAGKLDYKVIITLEDQELSLSGENPVTIRFKGAVPPWALIPHILVMFLAMLFSTRTGLEALKKDSNPRKLAIWTTVLLVAGGMLLGPIVQYFAFGALWTGFPFGYDLTDNKTLLALIFWIAALIAGRKGKPARGWVIGASIMTLIVFLIPHSLLGSELDYSKMETPANIQTS
jgi:hypothetical protein